MVVTEMASLGCSRRSLLWFDLIRLEIVGVQLLLVCWLSGVGFPVQNKPLGYVSKICFNLLNPNLVYLVIVTIMDGNIKVKEGIDLV